MSCHTIFSDKGLISLVLFSAALVVFPQAHSLCSVIAPWLVAACVSDDLMKQETAQKKPQISHLIGWKCNHEWISVFAP